MNTDMLKPILLFSASFFFFIHSAMVRADVEQIQGQIASGNLNEALIQTNRELARDDKNVTYRFLKGLILTRQDKLEQARDIFVEITQTNPELPEPYNNLAVIYAAMGDFDKARLALEEAINTHPAYATAHENIGDIYAKLASQAYNQALELDGDNNTAKAKLSLVNELFSMPDKAEQQPLLAQEEFTQPLEPPPIQAATARVAAQESTTTIARVEERQVNIGPESAASVQPDMPVEQQPDAVKVIAPAAAGSRLPDPQAENLARLEQERRQIGIIKQTVLDWASSWAAQDIAAYLSYYASDFSPPDGRSISQWRELRRQRLATPGAIKVVVADLVVQMLGTEHAQATFTQIYTSDVYSDRVKKTLLVVREDNKWLITLEKT